MTTNEGQFFIKTGHEPQPAPVVRPAPRPAAPVALPVPAPAQPVVQTVQGAPTGRAPFAGTLDSLLAWLVQHKGSDLHLAGGEPPRARINGDLVEAAADIIPNGQLEQMIDALLNDRLRQQYRDRHDIDLAYQLGSTARFRVNVMRKRGMVGAVFRTIPSKVLTAEDLDLPQSLRALSGLPRGLVLVTGPTGSGKSTTLAAMVDLANRTRAGHIITIEDPIEFTHAAQRSVVSQREVGTDTDSFDSGLRAALRQDPDVILVGELRDQETTRIALEAAETGHLVFATMHTKSAAETIDRFVGMFPDGIQNQIRGALASALEAVVVQTLVKTSDGAGRVAAREILLLDAPSRALIRQHKLEQMGTVMQGGAARGMTTLDADLARLVDAGQITREAAESVALNPKELEMRLTKKTTMRSL